MPKMVPAVPLRRPPLRTVSSFEFSTFANIAYVEDTFPGDVTPFWGGSSTSSSVRTQVLDNV
ncbi:MAG: hypothetical protein Q9184_000524 [Pyrenodesmia sp. 2 TL-2023]